VTKRVTQETFTIQPFYSETALTFHRTLPS
jgi:hypothetical protein